MLSLGCSRLCAASREHFMGAGAKRGDPGSEGPIGVPGQCPGAGLEVEALPRKRRSRRLSV